jgi:hypothetical protein
MFPEALHIPIARLTGGRALEQPRCGHAYPRCSYGQYRKNAGDDNVQSISTSPAKRCLQRTHIARLQVALLAATSQPLRCGWKARVSRRGIATTG